MSDKSFFNKLNSFFLKLKKQGFTLAEALIITVMTGYCLLPILGTMQNAQTRTQNYDHQSKMQLYSRSRLNSIIANAAFDHTSINTKDEYHYIVYFADCKNSQNGKEEDAKLVELPKTSVTLDKMIHFMDATAFNIGEEDISNHPDVYRLLGLEYNPRSPKPYLKLVHAYKTTVELKEQPMLEYIQSNGTPQSLDSPKALLGIVVKTCLLQSNDETYDETNGKLITGYNEGRENPTPIYDESVQFHPVTLFSFVNLPTVSDEMIWLADAYNCKIYGIDSVSKTISSTIDLPQDKGDIDECRPWHIAVHPSLKFLAVLRKTSILLVNIERKSTDFGKYKEYLTTYTFSDDVCSDGDRSYYDGAIAFRPDGKFLYCYSSKENKLYRFGGELNSGTWNNSSTDPPKFYSSGHLFTEFDSSAITGFVPANDGYLYISFSDNNYIYRVPMYCQDETSIKQDVFASSTSSINSIDVSPDGLKLAAVTTENSGRLRIYDTRDRKLLKNETIYVGSGQNKYENPFKAAFVAVSSSTRSISDKDSLNITVTNNIEQRGNNGAGNELILAKVFKATDSIFLRNIDVDTVSNRETVKGSLVVVSPDNQSVVIADQKNPQVYIGKTGVESESEIISESKETLLKYANTSETKNCSDLATNKRDVLAVACDKNVKIYDLNTKKEIEDSEFTATDTITSISMSPQGDFLLTCHDIATGSYLFNLTDNTTKNPEGINSIREKIVFDDNHPNMAFALQTPLGRGDKKFYNISHTSLDRWETVATDSYDRRAFTVSDNNWESLDMIAMPRGGAMVLYGKSDGSSMIEWIGRRNWNHDPKKDKYKLFSRWTNIKKNIISNLNPETKFTNINSVDSAKGSIVVAKTPLTKNSIINTIIYLKTYNNDGGYGKNWYGGYRYITPIIIKKSSSGTEFSIVNIVKSPIRLEKNKSYDNIKIEWENPFTIDEASRYYIGWWNGNNNKANFGAVGFKGNDSGNCLSDMKDLSNNTEFESIPSQLKNSGYTFRDYSIQFGYIQEEEYFPPLDSKKLAISPDCGTLAILSEHEHNSTNSDIHFYDFTNHVYGPETQIEGMLVDYRDAFQSGSWPGSTPTFGWPNETVRHFKKVRNHTHFNGKRGPEGLISSLASATTKYDSWTSFNNYPANYFFNDNPAITPAINNDKKNSNKRFIGYLRPEYDAAKLQACVGDDVRFFLNNSFIYGRYDTGSPVSMSNATINCKAYETNLFQIDQTSNGDGTYLSPFLGKDTATCFGFTEHNSTSVIENYYSPATNWNNINSSETYILKNIPPLIYTKTLDLNPTNSDILFSRDKARPILYILDKTNKKLWECKNYSSFAITDSANINSNPIISTNGQKLLFVGDKVLKAIDITSDTINSSENLVTLSDDNTKTRYLANKPLSSFSSGKVGGSYSPISISESEDKAYTPEINGAMTVADCGIYIFNNSKKGFLCYKPKEGNFSRIGNRLSKNAPLCPITSYDNKIYVFGNNGTDSNDPISNRVQCYDIVKDSSMTTLKNYGDDFNDKYQVSLGVQYQSSPNLSSNNYKYVSINNYFDGESVSNSYHAFINSTEHYAYTSGTNPYIHIKFNSPLTTNKIKISNYYSALFNLYVDGGVMVYDLKGNSTSDNIISNLGSIGQLDKDDYSDIYETSFTDKTYQNYKLYLVNVFTYRLTSEDYRPCGNSLTGVNRGCVSLIQLWRTGVKRLTPNMGQFSSTELSSHLSDDNKKLTWTNAFGQETVMRWSSNDDSTNLGKLYTTNAIQNNYFTNCSNYWKAGEQNAWVKISLPEPEALSAIRFANKNNDGCDDDHNHMVKTVQCYGSNANNCPAETDRLFGDSLEFTNNSETIDYDRVFNTFLTAEIKNPKKYKHYLIKLTGGNKKPKIVGFQLYASCEQPTKDFLTPLQTDQLGEVNVGAGAVCATPYGLVTAGGHIDDDSSSYATTTALLYWPHAINRYDGTYKQYGISRSLPELNSKRYNHVLVWHKGKVYAIGGSPTNSNDYSAYTKDYFVECLDYNKLNDKWDAIGMGSYTAFINEATDQMLTRYYHGACSFGDEIFIFGGKTKHTGDPLTDAFAWNPETGVVRKIADLPKDSSDNLLIKPPICAVTCGSKIYLAGNDGASPAHLVMYEYTP